jgi:hypothetical protein
MAAACLAGRRICLGCRFTIGADDLMVPPLVDRDGDDPRPHECDWFHCDCRPGFNDCAAIECVACGRDVCPHGDPFHYHHDGCPSCSDSAPPCGDENVN